MALEKAACSFSAYPVQYCNFENIDKLDPETSKLKFVPVGSVEFTKAYSEHVGIDLPCKDSSLGSAVIGLATSENKDYFKRRIKRGKLGDASADEFVKPVGVKLFTGAVKSQLRPMSPDTAVWISDYVKFESEYRFYIQDFVNGPEVVGWSRYDDGNFNNPSVEHGGFDLVESLAQDLHNNLPANAYSIDIGWRPDLNEFSVVEVNDAWALGLYQPTMDCNSNPPTRQQYADMLVSRWAQILFCNLV